MNSSSLPELSERDCSESLETSELDDESDFDEAAEDDEDDEDDESDFRPLALGQFELLRLAKMG